jgi:superfamily II RNA helicase
MSSTYLRIIEPQAPCPGFPAPDTLATEFPFPLDPFQKHAIKAIHEGDNVLVTAKTGSGKTLVGEYLIHHVLKKGGRVFYTTPIKSLSNQKFHDLKRMYPSVGILTGDIKYRPDAQILIMTTEILRNLLYKQGTATAHLGLTASISLEGLQGVVFDEVHYINDRERGKVWEETMILLPRDIQLVLLSATLDHPELFASWLGDLKEKPIHLISTSYRIVPLHHQVLQGQQPQLIMDNNEMFDAAAYTKWLQWRQSKAVEARKHEQAVSARRAGGFENPVAKGSHGISAYPHQLNEMITLFKQKDLLPALFFVLSKAGCEKYASLISHTLVDSSDSAAIRHIWDFHLRSYTDILETLPQAHTLKDLVMRGIAFHHSGLLPVLREMVEILFGRGLIKVLFATETFAVGLNMPTKTVVFSDLSKYSDETQGMRLLRTDEYIQMAGRAGRRGKDTMGHVFYLPQREPIGCGEMKQMLTGRKSPIISRMDFGYDFLLKTAHGSNLRWMDILEKSYWYQQREMDKKLLVKDMDILRARIDCLEISEEKRAIFEERTELEARVKTTVNAARKDAQRKLSAILNKCVGPVWEKSWKTWQQRSVLEDEYENLARDLRILQNSPEQQVKPRVTLLQKWGFLEKEGHRLTPDGILATELNEGQSILMVKAYRDSMLKEWSHEEVAAWLAAFVLDGKEEDAPSLDSLPVSSRVKEALWKVNEWACRYSCEEEDALGNQAQPEIWKLQTTWIEPIYRWVNGDNAALVCSENGLYEGNFMRAILKVANMVEEWVNMATYQQDIEMLEQLEGLREKLVKGLAKPDSLYLRLE